MMDLFNMLNLKSVVLVFCFTAFLLSSERSFCQHSSIESTIHHVSDSISFLKWWDSTLYNDDRTNVEGLKRIHLVLSDISKADSCEIIFSNFLDKRKYKAIILRHSLNLNIKLIIPTDSLPTQMGPETEYDCINNKSYLSVNSSSDLTELELNPYCNEVYGPGEVDLIFYWIKDLRYPYFELVTNGPACIPIYLYKFDTNLNKYVEIRNECGG